MRDLLMALRVSKQDLDKLDFLVRHDRDEGEAEWLFSFGTPNRSSVVRRLIHAACKQLEIDLSARDKAEAEAAAKNAAARGLEKIKGRNRQRAEASARKAKVKK